MSRALSIGFTTVVCFVIAWGLTFNATFAGNGTAELSGLMGALFGFWLSYTGRLHRMFRRVDGDG